MKINNKGGGTMNKHESKYFSTAILMDEALISLLDNLITKGKSNFKELILLLL